MAGSGTGKGSRGKAKGAAGAADVALDETVAPDELPTVESPAPEGMALDATVVPDAALDATMAADPGSLDETLDPDSLATDETVAPDALESVSATGSKTGATLARPRSSSKAGRRTLARGDELGRYVVLSMLGAGVIGEVYTCL